MTVGFVFTNHNNSSYTRAAVASLHAGSRRQDVRIVVVDNKSSDEDIAALKRLESAQVDVVFSRENVGYFRGLNAGIRHLRGKFPDVEHVVVGNNDLIFPETFVETLQRHGDVFDTWAVICPDLVTLDGVHQNPHVVYPVGLIRRLIWDLYYLSYGSGVLIQQAARMMGSFVIRPERAPQSELFKTSRPITMGFGACYVLGPVFFRHFTRLCAPTFMMQEEFFIAEQLKAIGQVPYYDARFVVTHHDHATTAQLPGRRQWQIARDAHRVNKRYLALSPDARAAFIAAHSRADEAERS